MSIAPLISEKTRTSDAVLRVLEDAGIEMVFGISGGHTGACSRPWPSTRIPSVP